MQFEFIFSNRKAKKHTVMISPKIVNEVSTPTNQTFIMDSLSLPKPAKNPRDYEKRDDVKEFEQKPISSKKGYCKRTNGFKSSKKKGRKKN